MPEIEATDIEALKLRTGRLMGELRAVRQKQARLRYQIRYLLKQHTKLREIVQSALDDLDEDRPEEAIGKLERGLVYAQHDPDTRYTPPGAKRRKPRAQD